MADRLAADSSAAQNKTKGHCETHCEETKVHLQYMINQTLSPEDTKHGKLQTNEETP